MENNENTVEQNNVQNNTNNNQQNTNNVQNNSTGTSKAWVGVLAGLFLGLWGLLFLLAYKEGSEERRTFIKGWLWTFIICTAASIIICVLVFVLNAAFIQNLFHWANTMGQ